VKVTGDLTLSGTLDIAPGVLVQFMGYYSINSTNIIRANGIEGNPIRFSMFDTTGFTAGTGGRWKNIRIDNFNNSSFRYCNLNYGEGFYFRNCSNLIIENCSFQYMKTTNAVVYCRGDNNTLRKNYATKCYNGGTSWMTYVFNVWGYISLFEENTIINNDLLGMYAGGRNMTIQNNLFAHNTGGILAQEGDNHYFFYNTFAYNENWGVSKSSNTGIIANCIFFGNESDISTLSYVDELFISNNILQNSRPARVYEILTNNIITNPYFRKPYPYSGPGAGASSTDYSLSGISPAIDKGINTWQGHTFPVTDLIGNPRINHGTTDIGAYENQGSLPVITVQPAGGNICEGQNITLGVTITATDTMLYQWRKDGVNITGATLKQHSITRLNSGHQGSYTCLLSNAYGNVESYPAIISVLSKPTILFQSDVQKLFAGQELSLEVSATGQVPLTYVWQKNAVTISGATSSRYKITSTVTGNSGTYRSIVSNLCGKDTSDNIPVTVNALPVVNIGKDTTLCANNKLLLDPGVYRSYLWHDYSTNRYKAAQSTGTYFVKVTDNNGCEATSNSVKITVNQPYANQKLCMVTVDMETQKNMIIWDDTKNAGIRSYNIYKLFGSNLVPIGNVISGRLPVYIDYSSSPEAVAARYAITVTDTCGNESGISTYHQTIQLGASAGIQPNTVVLDWTPYIDESNLFIPSWYYIYRGPSPDKLVKCDSVSSAFTSWNDMNPGNNVFYQVSVKKPAPCDPAHLLGKKASAGPFIHSLSNLEDNRLYGTAIEDNPVTRRVVIYPNPMSTECRLAWINPGRESYEIRVFDLKGNMIRSMHDVRNSEYTLKREALSKGLYIIEIRGKDLFRGKMVVE